MDVFKKCFEFTRAEDYKKLGLYPYFTEIEKVEGNHVWVDGKKILMVGSNNYLGLFDDSRIKAAAIAAVEKYGTSTCGSRFLNGTYSLHVELEKKLAQFMGKEEALTFSTGMQTNLGAISALAGRNDVIVLDRMVHASIMDAVRLSYAHIAKFKHNDMKDLEDKLAHQPAEKGKLIIVDGVFSMEGDLSNLPQIVKLAKKYHARLMVDDAHGVGVMGEKGRGHGRTLRPGRPGRPDHDHLLQVVRLAGRIRGRRQHDHPVHQASCPVADLFRFHHPARPGRRAQGPGDHPDRTLAPQAPVGDHPHHEQGTDGHGLSHRQHRNPHHPGLHQRHGKDLHALEIPARLRHLHQSRDRSGRAARRIP